MIKTPRPAETITPPPGEAPDAATTPARTRRRKKPEPAPVLRDLACDITIIGAGPAGLAMARSLAGHGMRIVVVERAPIQALANPSFDGREIALTHESVAHLQALDAWDLIPDAEKSPMGEAKVINGPFDPALRFQPQGEAADRLGYFVPNYLIRRALFDCVRQCPDITVLDQRTATAIATTDEAATLALDDGSRLVSRLIVAADTRFSEMRRRMGITARRHDFGKSMMVCRMAHDLSHHQVATEWFSYGKTMAILPLNGTEADPHVSSFVLTMLTPRIERLKALDADAFSAEATRLYQGRLGTMRLLTSRHAFPLVSTYADRFVARRFALAGDAAVGMHPVTAHGFNFGMAGAKTLASVVTEAFAAGGDIGAAPVLAAFEARHRRTTGPLYLATNATVSLFTNDRFPARIMRDVVIRAGAYLAPVRRAVSARLMVASEARRTAGR